MKTIKRTNTVFLLAGLFIANILMSGCASILNGKYQKVAITTNNENASVYVNGQLKGKGKTVNTVLQRDCKSKQIKVEVDGYKPEYYVHQQTKRSPLKILSFIPFGVLLYPMMYDIWPKAYDYEKTIKTPVTTKVIKHTEQQKFLKLKTISADIKKEDFIIDHISLKQYKSNKANKKAGVSLLEENIKFDNTIFSEIVSEALKSNGFLDTSGKILNNLSNTMSVNAKITKVKLSEIISHAGSYHITRSIVCEATIDWEFINNFNQVKYKTTNTSNSGHFAVEDNYAYSNAIKSSMEDAVSTSFYKILVDSTATSLLLINKDEQDPSKFMSILSLEKPEPVTTLKAAQSATVTISTSDGFGSGCIISKDGYLVTNYHVVAGDSEVTVIYNSGDSTKATIVRYNEVVDLALLKTNKTFNTAFHLSEDENYDAGDEVFAVGTPTSIEFGQTISRGIISGIRKRDLGEKLIQTDVSINPGNSGGALIRKTGEFIGVVTAKVVGFGLEGIAFATPANAISSQLKVAYKKK